MSTAAESPPPESPAEAQRPAEDAQRPAEGARSGADAGWAVPGVTGQTPASDGSGAPASRQSSRAGGSSRSRGSSRGGSRGRSGDADPADVLTSVQVEALADVSAAVAVLAEVSGSVSGVQALTVARQVHTLTNQLSGVHAQVLATAAAGQAWAGDGFVSAPRWLAESHLISPRVARDRVADADWLLSSPMFAESLGAGRISPAHITVLRRITAATDLRRAAFAKVAVYWVTVAQGRDPDTLAALLRAWAALVDDTEDDKAEKAWRNRALRVTQVGDEWVITGRLPAVEGARLSAVLNEIMDIDRRTRCQCDPAGRCVCPEDVRTVTQRRADALLAIVDAVTARTTTRRPPEPTNQPEAATETRPEAQPDADSGADADTSTRPATDADAKARTATGTATGSATGSATGTDEATREAADAPARSPTGPEPSGPPSSPRGSEPGAARWSPPNSGSRSGSGSGSEGWPGLAPGWNTTRLGDRTRVVLVIRADDLNPPAGTAGPIPGPATRPEDLMSTWATANGPGTGLLARITMLRELCDTTVQRLIVGPDSQPLDIGRATRTIPAHIRTALHVRDRGCVFPGCDRPPGWTEGHHISHWAAGGVTAIQNLASLCSRHHHRIHTGKWAIQMGDNGHPDVTKVHTYPKRN